VARDVGSAGLVLTQPDGDARGVFLVNGARIPIYARVAASIRERHVTVLTHWWSVDRARLREYRRHASLFDAVASPSERFDRKLGFAPVFRSNSSDLWVDDSMWPLLELERDVDVVESTSVPWVIKQPLRWLHEVRELFERRGGGRAVYMTKREPHEKETDERCHRDWARFKEEIADDPRVTLVVRASQEEVARLYNRAKVLYHPCTSEFGPRCVTEALYCGALIVLDRHDWAETATAHPELRRRIVVQDGLLPFPEHEAVDVRRWQTTAGVRARLLDFLVERRHRISTTIEPFTMFSSKRLEPQAAEPSPGRPTSS